MLSGIIRTFLATSTVGSLTLGGLALASTHIFPNQPPQEAAQAAGAIAFVASGNAFPLLVRDIEAINQLRDIVATMDGTPPAAPDIARELAAMGLAPPAAENDLMASAGRLLEKTRLLLRISGSETETPSLVPAGDALKRFEVVFAEK